MYEIVLTVLKGGAFARYRWGCLPLSGTYQQEDETRIPRFEYIDRYRILLILPVLQGFRKIPLRMLSAFRELM